MNQTNPIKLAAALFCVVLLTTMTARAQIESESAANLNSNETLTFKREFSPHRNRKDNRFAPRQTELFGAENAADAAPNGAARQQTYVRPTKAARFKRYASDAFGVPALIGSAFGATVSQIGDDPPEWKKNAGGFGKRFASSYGTNAIRNTVSYGLSEAFKLDNRFEKSGQQNFGKRLKHVFLGSYTTRAKNGKRLPDFPFVTGTYTAAIIANETWMPDRFSYKDGLRDGTVSLGIRFGVNLLREFIFPK